MAWRATNSEGYEAPAALAADVVVLTVRDAALTVLAVRRDDGAYALPGGFVGPSEPPAQTARRKLREKTGLDQAYLEQLGTFAAPGRDPRGWIPTVAYLALVPTETDAGDAWLDVHDHPPLAFDHEEILRAAVDRVEGKLWWSNVAVGILAGAFSMAEARSVYEAIAGIRYDPATFSRDLKATGLIEPTGEHRSEGPGRPAALFRFVSSDPAWGAGRRKRVAARG